jgi:hypothetical protein
LGLPYLSPSIQAPTTPNAQPSIECCDVQKWSLNSINNQTSFKKSGIKKRRPKSPFSMYCNRDYILINLAVSVCLPALNFTM